MTHPEQELPQLVKRLHGLTAHPPPERVRADIAKLMDEAHALFDAAPPEQAQDTRMRMALLLHARAAASEDAELRAFYVGLLPGLGVLAAPLALVLLAEADEESPLPVLTDFPEIFRFELVNRILLDDTAPTVRLRGIALAAVDDLAALPADTLNPLLADMVQHAIPLAFPLADALIHGPYGELLRRTIAAQCRKIESSERPGPELHDVLPAIVALADETIARLIIPLLAVRDPLALKAVLSTLTALSTHADDCLGKALLKPLTHPDQRVRTAALDALISTSPRDAGRILAAFFRRDTALRAAILSRAPLLAKPEAITFLTCQGVRDTAPEPDILRMLIALDTTAARAALSTSDMQDMAVLDMFPPMRPEPRLDAARAVAEFSPAPEQPKEKEPSRRKDKGFLGSLFGGGDTEEALSIQFGGDMVLESEHAGKRLSPIYEGRTLRGASFRGCLIENGTFEDCVFVDADFTDAILIGTRFAGCSFENCTFDRARFFDANLFDLRLSGGHGTNVAFAGCRLSLVDSCGAQLDGLFIGDCTVQTVRLTACDLTRCEIRSTHAGGVEMRHCLAEDATIADSDIICSTFTGTAMPRANITGLHTDSPHLARLRKTSRLRRAAETADSAPAMDKRELSDTTRKAARAVLDAWFEAEALQTASLAFRANNDRRVAWCLGKLGHPQADFFRLAPFFLHTETFERNSAELEPLALACRVSSYVPDYTTIEAARRHFPGASLPPSAPDPVHIEALYTIGSVGTIAQSESSDLDYWVCYDPEDMPEVLVDGLKFKMEAIERWADATFGLEVHFFTMDVTRIQDNNFGVSDAESSGTAQALLLKEEFYRTAVHAAGRIPVWWATPTGADDAAYTAAMRILTTQPWGDMFIDLGNLVDIPAEEFFGASLWQIVKALKSPFKSIMKFGLLEKYIATESDVRSPLLCERLKTNILAGRLGLADTDPYLLLFREVLGHYARAGEKDSVQLVRLSFFLKARVGRALSSQVRPLRREEREMADLFCAPGAMPSGLETGGDWPFQRLVTVGSMVNRFIVRTYMRVRDSQQDRNIAINPEDLTKLGRKIFATFSRRKNKIEHIPFMSLGGSSFRVLHFSAQAKKMGQPGLWEVQGAQEVSDSRRLDLVDLRKGPDLAEHVAWLTANGIYRPGMEVRGDYSISPVSARDLQRLMDRLVEFFPTKATFNTDISEMLKPERIVRAFFALNLVQPREQTAITEVSVIYATNWGELFCRTISVVDTTILDNPIQFLLENVEQEFTQPPEIDFFAPDRSSFPRPHV
ncbi:adenylate cyclase class 1 [Desulfobaculum xiamenense]|uniref:Adenylate cyclase class 1 n=1 Tax=Desulfobaculum xiamenense TaxID=995050 RepID=A0A846QQZ1_9BACT|nr:class I adenylate cyclase [Desulfobaculum xiamenense]NJB68902.1 adenylate cyclase class 1 [Desulfobaculum xiamenense]